MKTTQEKIKIMQAYDSGHKIEACSIYRNEQWYSLGSIGNDPLETDWNWELYDYRIKKESKDRLFAWNVDEIPNSLLNGTGWMKNKNTPGKFFKLQSLPIDAKSIKTLYKNCEWTPDANPYTTTEWRPCGKIVKQNDFTEDF